MKSSLEVLFDLSFSEFITTRIIKVLFIIGIILAGLGAIALIFAGFKADAVAGILGLIFSPAIFLLYVLFARMWCELIIVIFRIAENTARMADQGKM